MFPFNYIRNTFEEVFGYGKDWYAKLTSVKPRVYHKYLRSTDKAILYPASVTYNANTTDTVTVPAAVATAVGESVTVGAAPTRTGYTFKSWNTAADGTGTSYAAGASLTVTGAVVLYAIWTAVVG